MDEMTVGEIELGGLIHWDGKTAERVSRKMWRRHWPHAKLPHNHVPFVAVLPGNKLDWWTIPADEEVEHQGSADEWVRRN